MNINTAINTNNTTNISRVTNRFGNAFNRVLSVFRPKITIRIDNEAYLNSRKDIDRLANKYKEAEDRLSDSIYELEAAITKTSFCQSIAVANLLFNNYVTTDLQLSILQIMLMHQQRNEPFDSIFSWDNTKERIFIKEYDDLTELPSDIKYDKSINECPISFDKLKKGDTVYCEKQLYSYNTLKNVCIKGNGLVPHNRSVISWDKNIYKLPDHGED
jgi:hypothetical protein